MSQYVPADQYQQSNSCKNNISPKCHKALNSKGLPQLVNSISQTSLLTSNIGTSTYLSPEQEAGKEYNEKVDIFALGLILCELYSKFGTFHERIATLNDLKYRQKLPESMLKSYPIECEIMLMMVKLDASERPSAEDLLKHPIFQQWEK